MIEFMECREKTEETEKCLDSELWHACAGTLVKMPPVNTKVFYFPQGHLEHVSGDLDFRNCPRIPPYVPCKVSSIGFMADPETDEVFAKVRLVPISKDKVDFDGNGCIGMSGLDNQVKPASFAKTLTQSDANNGGGFSVPRYCAETIFPRLDYTSDPPVQTIVAKDVHGETWKFRHIYRGTPRRHLLTTGWSTFVNHKKLVAGDSIVFLRAGNGDLCVGIRRAKRGLDGLPEMPSGWNNCGVPYGGFSAFKRDDEGNLSRKGRAEPVIEAANRAANGQAFDVVYYPRAGTPEFIVKASLVKLALQIRWCSGMRFKMAFETEDSSRISCFMGTLSSAQVADPVRWPDSPWRLLQVTWDEPDLLQNVKRVNPWLVELVSSIQTIQLSPFLPPHKKLRLPQCADFPVDSQSTIPAFSSNPFVNILAGMQGARHAHYGLSLPHLKKLHFPVNNYLPSDRASNPVTVPKPGSSNDNVSCPLTMENSGQGTKNADNKKPAPFVLFGRPILTEKQISLSCSSVDERNGNACDEGFELGPGPETGHCKVFMGFEDVGRTLDLSIFGSYEELYRKLVNMFGIQSSEIPNHVLYRDAMGAVRQLGQEPFSKFIKTAKRLTIQLDSSSENYRSVDS